MMNLHRRILAGTALGLLTGALGAAPLAAAPFSAGRLETMPPQSIGAPIILAQATIEELRLRLQDPDLTEEERDAIQQQIDELEQQAPAEEAPAEAPPVEEPPAEEPTPEPEAPPAEAPAPEPEAPPTEEPAPEPEPEPEPPAAEEPEPEPVPEEAPAEEPAEEAPEEAPAEEPAPEPEPPVEEAPAEQPPVEEAPAEAPAEEVPAEEPAEPAPEIEEPAAEPEAEEPAVEPEAAPAEEPAVEPEAAPAEEPVEEAPAEEPTAEEAPAEEAPAEMVEPVEDPEGILPEGAAPVLDSQKEAAPVDDTAPAEEAPAEQVEPAEPPASDEEAQSQAVPVEVQPLTALEGQRVDEQQVITRIERREGAQVVREVGDRVVIQFNNQFFVESPDRPRITRGAQEVYYEDLRGGWTREVVVRENGVRVITIRDQYGDVIRRSRIMPDGSEYVLVYAGEREFDRPYRWRDPGRDLPPLRLRIPVSQYILEAERVDHPDRYYEFLRQPPIEPVRRLYSIDEVKYSARIRDTVRRIDLDVINFDFGSASISESEIPKLEGVADAMHRLLERNPAETFLIEGHTDAVGSDAANLVLSDRRAESVAAALTNVFDIPPENMVTQGYGERYLKVATQAPSRENRRVAIRRITPLVAPVARRN